MVKYSIKHVFPLFVVIEFKPKYVLDNLKTRKSVCKFNGLTTAMAYLIMK